MKQTLLSFLLVLMPIMASADAVEIDGIYYNLISKSKIAEVTQNPNKYSGDIVIYGSVTHEGVDYDVTTIGSSAFEKCYNLATVTIPKSVTSIGSHAFDGCSGLTSVNIPNSVTTIGSYAFAGCSSLTSVIIPSSVTFIDNWTFQGCCGLTSVDIPNSVTKIGRDAFSRCI